MTEVTEVPTEKRAPSWRRLGCVLEGQGEMTAKEALKTAGLDWTVRKEPVFIPAPGTKIDPEAELAVGNFVPVPSRYAITRDSDQKVMGIVGTDYEILQNRDAFQFADALLDVDKKLAFDTVGELRGGRWVFLTIKVPKDIVVAGVDPVGLYLNIWTSHDGSKSVSCAFTPQRTYCENTLIMAHHAAKTRWSVRHIGTLEGRLQEAKSALELTYKATETFEELANNLASQAYDEDQYTKLVAQLVKDQPRVQEKMVALYRTSPNLEVKLNGSTIRDTKWGALNAVAEWFDWGKEGKDPHAQVMSSFVGVGARARTRALELLEV